MSIVQTVIGVGERTPWPDTLTRAAINWLVGRTRRELSGSSTETDRSFASGDEASSTRCCTTPIAVANTPASSSRS